MAEHFAFLAFVLAACIGTAIYLHGNAPKRKSAAQLKREIEEAERHHAKRSHIRKLYVKAKCDQIRSEL